MERNLESIRTAVIAGLPVHARWMIKDTPLDYDFSLARLALRPLNELTVDVSSADLIVFGEYDYAEGGGAHPWLCVRRQDGKVFGFDEENEGEFLLNSSIERFIETFVYLNDFMPNPEPVIPTDCANDLMLIDPETFPFSDWKLLLECVTRS